MHNAIISKTKLEEMRGLGIIDEDVLASYEKNVFESTRNDNVTELMVNIGPKIDAEIGVKESGKCILSVVTVRQLMSLGLVKMDEIDANRVTVNDFESKFSSDQKLIAFTKSSGNNLNALVAVKDTHIAVSDDGTVDLEADTGF